MVIDEYYGFKYPHTVHSTAVNDKFCIVCGQKNKSKEDFVGLATQNWWSKSQIHHIMLGG